jgi:hypothetical protein
MINKIILFPYNKTIKKQFSEIIKSNTIILIRQVAYNYYVVA